MDGFDLPYTILGTVIAILVTLWIYDLTEGSMNPIDRYILRGVIPALMIGCTAIGWLNVFDVI